MVAGSVSAQNESVRNETSGGYEYNFAGEVMRERLFGVNRFRHRYSAIETMPEGVSPSGIRRGDVRRRGVSLYVLLAVMLPFALPACDDQLDPFLSEEVERTIFSLARDELNRPEGIDFVSRTIIRIEVPGPINWDLVLDTRDGQLVLVNARDFGLTDGASVAVIRNLTFDEVRKVPENSEDYEEDEPIIVEEGVVYAIRTRPAPLGGTRITCRRFSKMEVVDADVASGRLTVRLVTNDNCEDARLVN